MLDLEARESGRALPPPVMLASVLDDAEARLALAAGADLIDAKDPATGALGALPAATIGGIVLAVAGRCPVSATVGDLLMQPDLVRGAVAATAATGVDIVKIGIVPEGDPLGVIAALGDHRPTRSRLFAVLFADRLVSLDLVGSLAAAGFAGVMLDTADKRAGALPEILPPHQLSAFLALGRSHGLLTGLAGSLRTPHISPLLQLGPDILGFRGALCGPGGRATGLDAGRAASVRALIPRSDRELPGLRARPAA